MTNVKIYGIDVSSHQGVIDWAIVRSDLEKVNNYQNSGFVIIRIGYSKINGRGGMTVDKYAARNLEWANKIGIPCGVYVYCYDTSVEAVKSTIKDAIDFIKDYKIEYPVVYDMEYEEFNKTAGKTVNTELAKAAMEVIEDAGYYAMLYASRDFFKNYLSQTDLTRYDKWEAAYTDTDTDAVKNGIWQYSSKNALGIRGFGSSLDCDIAYTDYQSVITKAGLNNLLNEQKYYNITLSNLTETTRDFIVNTLTSLDIPYNEEEVMMHFEG